MLATGGWPMIPEFPCHDCTVNTVPLEGEREYYEVLDSIWKAAGCPGKGQSDNGPGGFFLCIGCLEKRLGRTLTKQDFKELPANIPSPWLSARLNDRLGGQPTTPRSKASQYYPCALHAAVLERFNPLESALMPGFGGGAFGISPPVKKI
jgi:hypothetical protein